VAWSNTRKGVAVALENAVGSERECVRTQLNENPERCRDL
jgi:hypothetical protein